MSFFYSLEMADFSLSVKLFASAPKLCWKHFIVSRKRIWLPMFTIRISVGFFRPIFKSVVLHTPALKPFNKRKKSNLQRLCAMTVFVFINFIITEIMCVPYYFTGNVWMMQVYFIIHYFFQDSNKVFRYWDSLYFICFMKFYHWRV